MPGSRRVWRGISFIHLTLWAWLMLVLGLLCALGTFEARVPAAPPGFFTAIGIILIAMGQFVAAVTADRLFIGADPRVTGLFELAAWTVVVATVLAALAGAWI